MSPGEAGGERVKGSEPENSVIRLVRRRGCSSGGVEDGLEWRNAGDRETLSGVTVPRAKGDGGQMQALPVKVRREGQEGPCSSGRIDEHFMWSDEGLERQRSQGRCQGFCVRKWAEGQCQWPAGNPGEGQRGRNVREQRQFQFGIH